MTDLKNIISVAKDYIEFEKNKKDLGNIIEDKKNDKEMVALAEKELINLVQNREINEKKLKIFLLKKNPIIKIIIPDPKKTNNNSNKIISGNFIRQKLLISAIGNKILKQIKLNLFVM